MSVTKSDLEVYATLAETARTSCVSIIELCLTTTQKPLRYLRSYADGNWGVEVSLTREIILSGYAAEVLMDVSLEELSLTELAYLAREAETAMRKALR